MNNDEYKYNIYQAHHLSVVLATFFAESEKLYISAESLYVVAAMIRDLTDPKQLEVIETADNKKPA